MITIYIDTPEQATKYFNPLDWDLAFMEGDNIEDWTPITIDEKTITGHNPNIHSCHEAITLTADFSFESALEQAQAQSLRIEEK